MASPSPEIERRRRAIVKALRGDPEPAPAEERLARIERDVSVMRAHLAEIVERLHHRAGSPVREGDATPPANSAEEEPGDGPEVPPVPAPPPMSEAAARALFGY